jgi:hypothetical protein
VREGERGIRRTKKNNTAQEKSEEIQALLKKINLRELLSQNESARVFHSSQV